MPRNDSLSDNYASDRCSFFLLAIGVYKMRMCKIYEPVPSIFLCSVILGRIEWLKQSMGSIIIIVNLAPLYLSNHQKYLINHGLQKYSKGSFILDKHSVFFLHDLKIHICPTWVGNPLKWWANVKP